MQTEDKQVGLELMRLTAERTENMLLVSSLPSSSPIFSNPYILAACPLSQELSSHYRKMND